MEIVIATTTVERAQQMQQTLIGHTMSGESLEQRPQTHYTSAEDFLDAALRIYEITAIRLVPLVKYPSLINVVAEYRPAVFICEACGKEHSDYPVQLFGLDDYTHHFVCSPICRRIVQNRLDAEIQTFRAELAAIAQHLPELLGDVPPHMLCRYRDPASKLTVATFLKAVKKWRAASTKARQELVAVLCQRYGQQTLSLMPISTEAQLDG
jgi:hypothetical protein